MRCLILFSLLILWIVVWPSECKLRNGTDKQTQSQLIDRAIKYTKKLFDSVANMKLEKKMRSDDYHDDDDDDKSYLPYVLLAAASLLIPLLLGALALAAIVPFLGLQLTPINTAGLGGLTGLTGLTTTTGLTGLTGRRRRRRDASGVGFSSKLMEDIENFIKHL